MDLTWITNILKVLPLPWLIDALQAIGSGWIIYKLWQRNNDLSDRMLKMSQDNTDKYNSVVSKVTDTMNALISVFGGKK